MIETIIVIILIIYVCIKEFLFYFERKDLMDRIMAHDFGQYHAVKVEREKNKEKKRSTSKVLEE